MPGTFRLNPERITKSYPSWIFNLYFGFFYILFLVLSILISCFQQEHLTQQLHSCPNRCPSIFLACVLSSTLSYPSPANLPEWWEDTGIFKYVFKVTKVLSTSLFTIASSPAFLKGLSFLLKWFDSFLEWLHELFSLCNLELFCLHT